MAIAVTPYDFLTIEKLGEQELEEARTIQGVWSDGVTISHEFQPAAEVGGDWLDYFSLSDGTIGMYIGDVSGKGLPAAMYAALVVGTLRGIHKTGQHPSRVLYLLNKRLLLRDSRKAYGDPVCDLRPGDCGDKHCKRGNARATIVTWNGITGVTGGGNPSRTFPRRSA